MIRVPNSTPMVCGQSAMTEMTKECADSFDDLLAFQLLTLLFCELVQQARLAYAHVSYDDVFKNIGIVVRPG
jgi:hypothetical protein